MNEMGVSGGIDNSGISYLKTSQRSLRVLSLRPSREFFFSRRDRKGKSAEAAENE